MIDLHQAARGRWQLNCITDGLYGHTLNHRQVFSPDGRFAYYDTRNSDPEIGITDCVERIDLESFEVETLYRTANASVHGPGVGAVVCHPHRELLLFIHGLSTCDAVRPYSMTRRFGALLDCERQDHAIAHAESRCVAPPYPLGALRGGTHAHAWSRDGTAICFTYNDAVVEAEQRLRGGAPDLRTVGVMCIDRPVAHSKENSEQFSGSCWAMLVASVGEKQLLGTDRIESAREECWLGVSNCGLAFIGRLLANDESLGGSVIDEIFVARWPESIFENAAMRGPPIPASIDSSGRLMPMPEVHVRRVTHTGNRRYPGVQGPRNWLVSSPDGQRVYAPMRDNQGIVQLASIAVADGSICYLTSLSESIENQIAIDPSGSQISLVSNGRIVLVDLNTGDSATLPALDTNLCGIPGAVHFLPDGSGLLFHAVPREIDPAWQQLWTLRLH